MLARRSGRGGCGSSLLVWSVRYEKMDMLRDVCMYLYYRPSFVLSGCLEIGNQYG